MSKDVRMLSFFLDLAIINMTWMNYQKHCSILSSLNHTEPYLQGGRKTTGTWSSKSYFMSYMRGGQTTTDTAGYLVLKNYQVLPVRWLDDHEYLVIKNYPKSYLLGARTTTDTNGYQVLQSYPKSYWTDR